jgi:hypothetical protein
LAQKQLKLSDENPAIPFYPGIWRKTGIGTNITTRQSGLQAVPDGSAFQYSTGRQYHTYQRETETPAYPHHVF